MTVERLKKAFFQHGHQELPTCLEILPFYVGRARAPEPVFVEVSYFWKLRGDDWMSGAESSAERTSDGICRQDGMGGIGWSINLCTAGGGGDRLFASFLRARPHYSHSNFCVLSRGHGYTEGSHGKRRPLAP